MIKTEHAGAKNGGGHWGSREEAKQLSRVLRRIADKQAAIIVPDPPERTAKRRRKDTDRWCRGKVGREHEGECRNYYDAKGWRWSTPKPEWLQLVCKRCGRELDSWHGGSFGNRPRPAWAS